MQNNENLGDELTQLRARVATLYSENAYFRDHLANFLSLAGIDPEALERYLLQLASTPSNKPTGEADTKPLVAQEDVALMGDFMSGTTHRETYGKPYLEAWGRIRQALKTQGEAPAQDAPNGEKELK